VVWLLFRHPAASLLVLIPVAGARPVPARRRPAAGHAL
jgi:hypothetical protein